MFPGMDPERSSHKVRTLPTYRVGRVEGPEAYPRVSARSTPVYQDPCAVTYTVRDEVPVLAPITSKY